MNPRKERIITIPDQIILREALPDPRYPGLELSVSRDHTGLRLERTVYESFLAEHYPAPKQATVEEVTKVITQLYFQIMKQSYGKPTTRPTDEFVRFLAIDGSINYREICSSAFDTAKNAAQLPLQGEIVDAEHLKDSLDHTLATLLTARFTKGYVFLHQRRLAEAGATYFLIS